MELKKNQGSVLEIVVKKTSIVLQPDQNIPSARVVILTRPDEIENIAVSDNQVRIEGPGEYEVDDVTISALASPPQEGQLSFLYINIQTLEHSVLILPSVEPVPDKVVEQFGTVDVICLPFEPAQEDSTKAITKVLKAFPELKKTILVCTVPPDPKSLEELGSTVHPPVNALKLKDILQGESDTIELYSLAP
jgi:hypothetical protein